MEADRRATVAVSIGHWHQSKLLIGWRVSVVPAAGGAVRLPEVHPRDAAPCLEALGQAGLPERRSAGSGLRRHAVAGAVGLGLRELLHRREGACPKRRAGPALFKVAA